MPGPLTELESWYRDRSLDQDPSAGLFAVAFTILRLVHSLDGLTKAFTPKGLDTFEADYFLVRLARRLDELAKQLGAEPLAALAARLLQDGGTDPPEAAEFLPRKRPPRPRT
jgi:hypothetical protein